MKYLSFMGSLLLLFIIFADASSAQTTKATLFDFTGNGKTDFTVFNSIVGGQPIRWKVAGNPALPGANQAFIRVFDYGIGTDDNFDGDDIVPNDYRGDGKVDVAVRRETNGVYYVAQFPTGTGGVVLDAAVPWGSTSDVSGAEGDYDGDGKADYTVIRVNSDNSLTYYMLLSATNTTRAVPFGLLKSGISTRVFRGADFNGDGRDEIVFAQFTTSASSRPITYYVGDAVTGAVVLITNWGDYSTDFSMTPADYTGDGKADLAAVRESSSPAVWYVRNTATGQSTATAFGIGDPNFANYDYPIRGDYDGDGRQDIAVWRPSNQTFYFINSSTGTATGQKWGDAASDIPLATLGTF